MAKGRKKVKGGAPVPEKELFRRTLEESYEGPAWHGPSVLSALSGLTAMRARWRPGEGRNSIWELVLHLAYSRHRVLGRLARANGRPVERFRRPRGLEWFPLLPGAPDEAAWRADLELLGAIHGRLLAELDRTDPSVLELRRKGSDRTLGEELLGLSLHDAYHGGQIRLLAKLAPD